MGQSKLSKVLHLCCVRNLALSQLCFHLLSGEVLFPAGVIARYNHELIQLEPNHIAPKIELYLARKEINHTLFLNSSQIQFLSRKKRS